MIKLQQYYVFKLTTSRIAESNYNIDSLTVSDARLSSELVQIGDNQVFRMIRSIKDTKTNHKELNRLVKERNNIKLLPSSGENSMKIESLQKKIDDILHIPDIINVKVDDKKVYKKIYKEGFIVNGITYKRFCSGAGQSRQSVASFCNIEIIDDLTRHLNCGLNIKEINIAKYNAYFGLYMSATYPVRTPKVCVIPDCEEYKLIKKVDWIDDAIVDGKEKRVVTVKDDFEFIPNMWDGQGLISPTFAEQWQEDLKLKYLPAQFVVRSSFIKGLVATFDFHKFAKDVAKTDKIKDIYGHEWNINEIDIILSASQFKMHKFYKSWDEFLQLQSHHGLSWGVTKVNPKFDNEVSLFNYQYVQTLDLNKDSIKELISPTLEWIEKVCSGDKLNTLLFLLGSSRNGDTVEEIFSKTNSNFIKAILYNDKLLNDTYIKKKIYDSISTKIDEAKIGRVWVNGNYQFMISDPYGQAQFAFNQEVTGLLKEDEYYSDFWNKKDIKKVDACRSPMVDFHEHNIIDFKQNEQLDEWFKYQNTGIIYNVWGVDTIRHSDSDWDGDIVFTTDNDVVLNNIIPNLNAITYDKASAKPQRLNNTNILATDLRSFNSKIGTITNYSTAFITMLANFKEGTSEYNEILERIKLLRRYIGDSIDQAKGIKTKPFPTEWKKRLYINKDDSDEVKQEKYYHNKLVANKKPYFMIYIYDKLKTEYRDYRNKSQRTCKEKFGCSLHQLMIKQNRSVEEQQYLNAYNRNMPVIKNNSIMNVLCKMVEEVDIKYKRAKNNEYLDESYEILLDKNIEINEEKLEKLLLLRKKFNAKRNFKVKNSNMDDSDENTLDEFYNEIRTQAEIICPNSQELSNHLVHIVYRLFPNDSKDFAWHIGIDGIIKTLENKSDMLVEMPMKDKDGQEYLGQKYSLRSVVV